MVFNPLPFTDMSLPDMNRRVMPSFVQLFDSKVLSSKFNVLQVLVKQTLQLVPTATMQAAST